MRLITQPYLGSRMWFMYELADLLENICNQPSFDEEQPEITEGLRDLSILCRERSFDLAKVEAT